MATRANRIAVRELRTLFNQGTIGQLTDGQLLERFATHDPEAAELAFAALVERHGSMVWRVCQSALHHRQDADDAFQATFLILVQKARSLWIKDSLGPWLHRVAHRIAIKARRARSCRRVHEQQWAVARPNVVPDRDREDDFAAILHEEIDRLPERHRISIVICDLQGFTHEKAARHLGWPVGTLKSRLAKARQILRGRLSRRGVAPCAGLFVAGRTATATASFQTVEVALPRSLAESTVRVATALATSKTMETVTATVAILIAEGLRTMFLSKLKLATIALSCLGAAAATTVVVLAQTGARPKPMPFRASQPAPFASGSDPASQWPPAAESAPAYITQSRAMIVTRLEEEFAEARARLERTLNKVGSPDDPAAIHARKTVDALSQVLARIDAVLVDAVETYPTMFDFSGGPAAVASREEAKSPMLGGRVDVSTYPPGRPALEAELENARSRLKWLTDMFSRGYAAKSAVDQQRQYFDRLSSMLEGKPGGSEPPDRQQQMQQMMNMGRMSGGPGTGMGTLMRGEPPRSGAMGMGMGSNLRDKPQRKGFDVRGEDRRRQLRDVQEQRRGRQQQAEQNEAQPQGQRQQPGQSQTNPLSQHPQRGQSQTQPQGQHQHQDGQLQQQAQSQQQPGQSQTQPQSQQQQPGQSQTQPQSQQQQSGQSQAQPENQRPQAGQGTPKSQGPQEQDRQSPSQNSQPSNVPQNPLTNQGEQQRTAEAHGENQAGRNDVRRTSGEESQSQEDRHAPLNPDRPREQAGKAPRNP